MYIKECEICNKKFESKTQWRRTCSKLCLAKLKKLTYEKNGYKKSYKDQICVSCQRATGKSIDGVVCSWARCLKPVSGWSAEKIEIKEKGYKNYETYDINFCPIFLCDEPRKKSTDGMLGNWMLLQSSLKNMTNKRKD